MMAQGKSTLEANRTTLQSSQQITFLVLTLTLHG